MSEQAQLRRTPFPALCLVTDLHVVDNCSTRLADAVSSAVENGVNMVQIRTPHLIAAEFDHLVDGIVRTVDEKALTIVNPSHRAITRYEGVDGVHLPENSTVPVSLVRELYGETVVIGRSIHDLDGVRSAKVSGLDYVVLGTIFPSESHPGGAWHGVEIISQVANETHLPVLGIGGITTENVGSVMSAGAHGIAVVRSILGAVDPGDATRELMEALRETVRS